MRIQVIGDHSYLGRAFQRHVGRAWEVDEISVRDDSWRQRDFRGIEAILMVAAIVHRPGAQDRELHFRVNRDLAREVCLAAVAQGVSHVLYVSSMAVYGLGPTLGEEGRITRQTPCLPVTSYGASKLAAEEDLSRLQSELGFTLSVVRPPMVYGPHCPGNYFRRLLWMGRCLPVFPAAKPNRLDMISITNLCELFRLIFAQRHAGTFCPSDLDGFGTADRLRLIAHAAGRTIPMSRTLGLPLRLWTPPPLLSLFGDLYFDEDLRPLEGAYIQEGFAESIAGCLKAPRGG